MTAPRTCVHFSLYLPQASRDARDDKGEGGASVGCDGRNDNSQTLFIPDETCRRQVTPLLMTHRFSAAPTALDHVRPISQPFRAGLTFGSRPFGPCIHGILGRVISLSTCRRQVEVLGMTKGRVALPLGVMMIVEPQISTRALLYPLSSRAKPRDLEFSTPAHARAASHGIGSPAPSVVLFLVFTQPSLG